MEAMMAEDVQPDGGAKPAGMKLVRRDLDWGGCVYEWVLDITDEERNEMANKEKVEKEKAKKDKQRHKVDKFMVKVDAKKAKAADLCKLG